MKCYHCGSHVLPSFQPGDYVEVLKSSWAGYRGFIMEVNEDLLIEEHGCPYFVSVVDDDKNHIDLTSWWDGPSLRLISGAGTYLQSYGELFSEL